jgi:predicted phage terminase large subunit-like protein
MHDGERLGDACYVDYLCNHLQQVADGSENRLIVNLPPRHLKTFLGAVCLPAWMLGRQPATKVMIVTHTEQLANAISYDIRKILQAGWYKAAFKSRLADDKTKVNDFSTTQGGGVYAASIEGSITGRGADLLIVDDPLDIGDANNIEHIQKINSHFDTKVMSRLNNRQRSRAVIIAHRLNEEDLSGHLIKQGGWRLIALPMIARRRKSYDLGHEMWQRAKDDLLRPDAFGKKELRQLQATISPDFETLYQQNPGGSGSPRLKEEHFQAFDHLPTQWPVVLSIDPGQRGGSNNSYSVIQAWARTGSSHWLLDQWRVQCLFDELRSAYWTFVRRYRPVIALIEATAMGPHLISEGRRRPRPEVIDVFPSNRSKVERLTPHIPSIKNKRIFLPQDAPWRADFVAEFLAFPSGKFDDQVDAASQYLEFAAKNPDLAIPERRALGSVTCSNGQNFSPRPGTPAIQTRGAVFAYSRRRF